MEYLDNFVVQSAALRKGPPPKGVVKEAKERAKPAKIIAKIEAEQARYQAAMSGDWFND